MNLLDIYATLSLNTDNYDSGIDQAKRNAEGFGDFVEAAIDGAAKAYTGLVKDSVSAYSDYEETADGIRRIFQGNADDLIAYSKNAYRTAQMSSSEYLENAQFFSGALLRALEGDTGAATTLIDIAMRDIADNVNAMGSDMSFVMNAYRGMARQEFRMLDNLYLGYGGTKKEARRLLYDMAELKDISAELGIEFSELPEITDFEKDQDFSMLTLDNMIKAIHVRQYQMNMAGVTLSEGATHIQGTIRTTRAAWEDLTKTFAGETDMTLDEAIEHFFTSVFGEDENTGLLNVIIPRISATMEGISKFLVKAAPILSEAIPEMIENIRPSIELALDSLTSLITEILPSVVDLLWPVFSEIMGTLLDLVTAKMRDKGGLWGLIADVVGWIRENANKIPEIITGVWGSITALKISGDVMEFLTLLRSTFDRTTLLVGVIGTLLVFAYLYRNELRALFDGIGEHFSNAIKNIQDTLSIVELTMEKFNLFRIGDKLGTDFLLGIANAINSGITMIEDAINSVLSQINIPFLFNGAEHPITLSPIDTSALEERKAELEKKDTEIDEDIAEKEAAIAARTKANSEIVYSSSDFRPFEQRLQEDIIDRALGFFGIKTDLFKTPEETPVVEEPKPQAPYAVPQEAVEGVRAYGEAWGSAGESALDAMSKSIGVSPEELLAQAESAGLDTSFLTGDGGIGVWPILGNYLGTELPQSVAAGTAALTGDEGIVGAVGKTTEAFSGTQTMAQSVVSYFTTEWLKGLSKASDVGILNGALQSIVSNLQAVSAAAQSALGDINALASSSPSAGGGKNTVSEQYTKRAFGGSVLAGESYWVGENGPEPFIPNQSGTIIPNNRLGGTSQQFVFNFYGEIYGDEGSFRSMVEKVAKGVIRDEVRAGA